MKLFDYKFLILLALTLVVYFMFREIIDLRNKIDTIESKVKTIEGTTNNSPKIVNKNKPKIESKPVFQIPLPKPPVVKEVPVQNNVVLESVQPQEKRLSTVNENEDATESESFANSQIEKLEIYSNDNLDNDDEEFSLGDSSEIDLNAIENELNQSDITESEEESNTSTNNSEKIILNDGNIELNVQAEDDSKKKNLLVEFEGTNLLTNLVTTSEKDIDMIISSNTSEIRSVGSGDISFKSLMKMKLAQLQCLAEEKEISLINEEKGKKKTKSELSNDLLAVLDV
jgi:hypothetical protein